MYVDENSSYDDLVKAAELEPNLYAMFDESKLLSRKYTKEEVYRTIQQWIQDGDEFAECA